MELRRALSGLLLAAALAVAAGTASACRLALALGLDVSGSVDAREYRLQMDGLAGALTDSDVRAALLEGGAPVALAVYEWSGSGYQRIVQDWLLVENDAVLAGLVALLRGWERQPAPEATGLAAAMVFGSELIARGPRCWDQTLDISGDGKNNDWPTPRNLRIRGTLGNLRINGLAVIQPNVTRSVMGGELGELPAYFHAEVIQGPGAFVETAEGFEDYARAMRRKLLKELATRPIGALEGGRENLDRF